MYRLTHVLSSALLVLAAAPAAAQQRVELRMLPHVGQTSHYRYTLQVRRIPDRADVAALSVTQIIYFTARVIARNGGLWTVSRHVDSSGVTSSQGRLAGDPMRGMSTRVVMDLLGRRDSTILTTPPLANPTMPVRPTSDNTIVHVDLSLPVHPVAVGDSWTDSNSVSIPVGNGVSGVEGWAVYRLNGLKRRSGRRLAVISFARPITINGTRGGPGSGRMTAIVHLDLDAGRITQMSIHESLDMPGTVRLGATGELQLLRQ